MTQARNRELDVEHALREFRDAYGRESVFSAAKVARRCLCSSTTARRYLEGLAGAGIVSRHERGRRVYYRLSDKHAA